MPLDIHVGFCNRRRPDDTRHWILILVKPGDPKCTWYHVTGGPQGNPPSAYRVQIQDGKRIDSNGIETLSAKIATISEGDRDKVKAAIQSVELQRCQTFTVAVLAKLEKKGLVPTGTSAAFAAKVETVTASTKSTSGSSGKKSGTEPTKASSTGSTMRSNAGSTMTSTTRSTKTSGTAQSTTASSKKSTTASSNTKSTGSSKSSSSSSSRS